MPSFGELILEKIWASKHTFSMAFTVDYAIWRCTQIGTDKSANSPTSLISKLSIS